MKTKSAQWWPYVWKVLVVVAVAVIAVAALWLPDYLSNANAQKEKSSSDAEKCEQAVAELKKKRDELRQELKDTETKIAGKDLNLASIVILYVRPDKLIVDEMLPVLEEKGFPATVCCGEGEFPGDPDCMTVKQANDLIEKGWEFGVILNKESNAKAICQHMVTRGLPAPKVAYYPRADFEADDPKTEQALLSLGIETVLQYNFVPEENDSHKLRYMAAYGCREKDGQTVLANIIAKSNKLAFTIGFQGTHEIYVPSSFVSMTNRFKAQQDKERMMVTNIDTAFSRRATFDAELEKRETELTKKKEDLEWQLQNTEDAITQIYHQYMN